MNRILEQEDIIIRQYHHPYDLPHIQRIFIEGTMNGERSPYQIGMKTYNSARLTYPAVGSIILLHMLSFNKVLYDGWLATRLSLRTLRWVQVFIGIVGLVGLIYLWYRRQKVKRLFQIFLDEGLAGELGDIVGSFNLHVANNGICESTSASGFWVAETLGEVVGFVGLNKNLRPDPTVGDVRRLVVAPTHQGRGIAGKLMAAITAHARAHRLHALELTTSDYNHSALRFYQRIGWKKMGRKDYNGFLIIVLRQELYPITR
ncbi:hypothetical protein H0H92_008000 [Tricholoma furcatifolium]|nr:hypothetical protein H0H92_008000 [Tricholoma furcatifolium]